MGWIVRVAVEAEEAEHASTLLWNLHTTGVAEATAGSRPELLAGFETHAHALHAAGELADRLSIPPPEVEPVDPSTWVDPDATSRLEVAGQAMELEVGPAFGHGAHPTTALALELLGDVVRTDHRVLDFGTGTGVLALAAAAFGAGAVDAVDNDPEAIGVARRNVARNAEVAGASRITVTDRLPEPPNNRYQVIVANVLLPVHEEMAGGLSARLAPGGWVIVSGILAGQRSRVEDAYAPLRVAGARQHDDWIGLVLR